MIKLLLITLGLAGISFSAFAQTRTDHNAEEQKNELNEDDIPEEQTPIAIAEGMLTGPINFNDEYPNIPQASRSTICNMLRIGRDIERVKLLFNEIVGQPPLNYTPERYRLLVAQFVLGNVNLLNFDQNSINAFQPSIIRYFLEQGADIDTLLRHDCTSETYTIPILNILAKTCSYWKSCLFLKTIEKHCQNLQINAQNTETGDTALHVAFQNRNALAVAWLLANGADVNITNNRGETPLSLYDSIIQRNNETPTIDTALFINDVMVLLRPHMVLFLLYTDTELTTAENDALNYLGENNVDCNTWNNQGQTPLDLYNSIIQRDNPIPITPVPVDFNPATTAIPSHNSTAPRCN